MVQQGEAPIPVLGLLGGDGLVNLKTPQQQVGAILVATGHPRRVEPRGAKVDVGEVQEAVPSVTSGLFRARTGFAFRLL